MGNCVLLYDVGEYEGYVGYGDVLCIFRSCVSVLSVLMVCGVLMCVNVVSDLM